MKKIKYKKLFKYVSHRTIFEEFSCSLLHQLTTNDISYPTNSKKKKSLKSSKIFTKISTHQPFVIIIKIFICIFQKNVYNTARVIHIF